MPTLIKIKTEIKNNLKKPAYWLIKTRQVKVINIGNQSRILKNSIIEYLLNR